MSILFLKTYHSARMKPITAHGTFFLPYDKVLLTVDKMEGKENVFTRKQGKPSPRCLPFLLPRQQTKMKRDGRFLSIPSATRLLAHGQRPPFHFRANLGEDMPIQEDCSAKG